LGDNLILLKDILQKLNSSYNDVPDDIYIESIRRNKNKGEVYFVINSKNDLEINF